MTIISEEQVYNMSQYFVVIQTITSFN